MNSILSFTIRNSICLFLFTGLILINPACNDRPEASKNPGDVNVSNDSLINFNKKMTKNENEEIGDFIARYQWNMIKTSTGLRYLIYHKGTGLAATTGKYATIKYSIRLLNGDLVYSSEQSGPKEFEIGHGGVESGLEEGILLLHVGDRAKIIVPSHLAFGLLGDQGKIPQRATLVYDIELIKLK
jgi:FKBP-type peptidyl-prolyl cis-trans isomerase FkpA